MARTRGSTYSEKWCDKIIDKILEGYSINQIGNMPDFPTVRTIFKWIRTYPELREAVTLAKEFAAERLLDECLSIADTVREDNAAISKAGLRVKARLAAIGRNAPRKQESTTVNIQNNNTATANAEAQAIATANVDVSILEQEQQLNFARMSMLFLDDVMDPDEVIQQINAKRIIIQDGREKLISTEDYIRIRGFDIIEGEKEQ